MAKAIVEGNASIVSLCLSKDERKPVGHWVTTKPGVITRERKPGVITRTKPGVTTRERKPGVSPPKKTRGHRSGKGNAGVTQTRGEHAGTGIRDTDALACEASLVQEE